MNKINWQTRIQNPMFVFQVILSILTPILGYAGLTLQDIVTWKTLGDLLISALSNPYCLGLIGVNLYNTILDPTTPGISDSQLVLDRNKNNEEK